MVENNLKLTFHITRHMAKPFSGSWTPLATKYEPLKVGSIDGTDIEPHDHGIVRASLANYRPKSDPTKCPEATLFVARLHRDVVHEDLQKVRYFGMSLHIFRKTA